MRTDPRFCEADNGPCCDGLPEVLEADYVLVGGGTSGAALASLLTRDRKTSVILIEAGLRRNDDPIVLDPSSEGEIEDLPEYQIYVPRDVSAFQPNGLSLDSSGKMWGGSSGHNALLTIRPAPETLAEWAAISGDSRWLFDKVLPAMLYAEHYQGQVVNPAERGVNGPLYITEASFSVDGTDPFVTAIAANGAPFSVDYNDPTTGNLVTGNLQQYIKPGGDDEDDTRSWSASAWLGPDVVDVDGFGVGGRQLIILSNAMASEILFGEAGADGTPEASGVRFYRHGRLSDVRCRKEVILCGGAVADPLLLQVSGIGPRALLESLGIEVRLDNPNVGANGQTTYNVTAILPVLDEVVRVLESFTDLSGPNTGFPPTSSREQAILWLSNVFGPTTVGLLGPMKPERSTTVEIATRVFPASQLAPKILTHTFEDADEQARLVAMLKIIGNISISYADELPISPDPSLYPAAEYGDYGGEAADDSDLVAWALEAENEVVFDTVGTCRMSASIDDGVVDGKLRVRGVRNLSICSNAVVPATPGPHQAYSAYLVALIKAQSEGVPVPWDT